MRITGVRKGCPKDALDTTLCLTPLNLHVKRCVAQCCIRTEGIGVLNVRLVGPYGRYGISGKTTDYIESEDVCLLGLRMLGMCPERA